MILSSPKAKACEIIDKYLISSPEELDLESLAGCEYLLIEDETAHGYQGRISFGKGYGIIKVNSQIKDAGQRRFVIAHEMGHYFNEMKKSIGCTSTDLLKFRTDNSNEYRANAFAAELLMHEPWIKDFTFSRKPSVDLIKDISSKFIVSVSSAAIRYSEVGKYPVCAIMTRDGKVLWSSASPLFPFGYIKTGQPVNSFSYAHDFFNGKPLNTSPNEVLADAWFLNDFNYKKDYYLKEQNLFMPSFNSVLTLLWECG